MSIQSEYRGSDELRALLIDAALAILRDPETPLDLRKVAEAAGKSRTAPYLVFGKESEGGGLLALRIAVAAEGARQMHGRMAAAAGAGDDPLLAFRRVATAFLEFVDENPRLFRLMYGPEISIVPRLGAEGFLNHREFQDLLAHRSEAGDVITDIILAAQRDGLLPPDPDDDTEARRIAALGDPEAFGEPGVWEATVAGGYDPRAEYPSLRYTLVAWASLIGIALLRLDEVLRAIRLQIPVEQAARIATEAVFGLDPNPATGAARMFQAARDAQPSGGRRAVADMAGAAFGVVKDSVDSVDSVEESKDDSKVSPAAASLSRESLGDAEGKGRTEEAASGPEGMLRRLFRRRGAGASEAESVAEDPDLAAVMSQSPQIAAEPTTLTRTLASHHGFRRATQSVGLLRNLSILWIDDHPESIAHEISMFRVMGGRVDVATDSASALSRLSLGLDGQPYSVVVSDIRREGRADEGVQALEQFRALAPATPVVFYVADLDRQRGVPAGAFGITDDVDELVHLVMDVLQGR